MHSRREKKKGKRGGEQGAGGAEVFDGKKRGMLLDTRKRKRESVRRKKKVNGSGMIGGEGTLTADRGKGERAL